VGKAVVLRFKDFPANVINPATVASPAILVGDLIVGVNDEKCETFNDVVKIIRSAVGVIKLSIERN
jgi:membrane-associated protease RseP (regulator of RpoE activity)